MIDTIKHDAEIYHLLVIMLVVLEGLFLLGKFKSSNIILTYKQIHPGFYLAIIISYLLGTSGGVDKENYTLMFDLTVENGFFFERSLGWAAINAIISKFTSNVEVFYLIISFVYVFVTYFFCKKNATNYSLLFLAAISFMGFYSMGTNTLKAGLSLSLCLIAFHNYRKIKLFFLFSLLAVLIHTTSVFPIFSFWGYRYINNTKTAIKIWGACFVLSAILGSIVTNYIGSYITDEYTSGYFSGESDAYNVGFRLDFILYSSVPIVIGYYLQYKKKLYDEFWHRLFITYILTNSIWLLLIRIPYTDRFAYLSWFLFPYILLLPLLKGYPEKRKMFLAYKILFGLAMFNYLLSLR